MPRCNLRTRNDIVKFVEDYPPLPRIGRAIVMGETELLGGFTDTGFGPGWILRVTSPHKVSWNVVISPQGMGSAILRITNRIRWKNWSGKIDREVPSIYDGDNPTKYMEAKMKASDIEICNISSKNNIILFDYDVRVDRESPLGNPFPMGGVNTRDVVCDKYATWLKNLTSSGPAVKVLDELLRLQELYKKHGKLRLFCWCAPKRCHAETIRLYILGEL
ncbi:hypothetical protein LCGC14_0416050 [marine sediment metagenome]|uniref:DUF4326 domain-containing protein n=1 Tax=marine sediment metagenome TaxID=412755 RepID=A0A0F9SYG9_9ZZZZ